VPTPRRVTFEDLSLHAPQRWRDITDTLAPGTPPTLALEDGIGALQISVGLYMAGKDPHIDAKTLERLLYEFEDTHGFPRVTPAAAWQGESNHIFGITCNYPSESEFIRIWYASDSRNIAFLTYVAAPLGRNDFIDDELEEAHGIACSLSFE
jgi:hypothetical protein